MGMLDDWHDIGRLIILGISLWCCFTLICDFRRNSKLWNPKTKDYWYAIFMWCVVGVVQPLQGIVLDRPLTPAFIVISAAVMVTGKGLYTRGPWGGAD